MAPPSRTVWTSVLAGFAAVAAALIVVAPPSGASIVGTANLTLSGASKGTLHEGSGGYCSVETTITGIDIIGLTGHISGAYSTAKQWSLELSANKPGGGTFSAGPPDNQASGELDPEGKNTLQSQDQVFNSTKKGSFTEYGDKGSVDMTFSHRKKFVTVKGSWDC
jgi:hypothetical protein